MVGDDTGPSDAELISRVRDGDRAAFGELYGRHARAAAALARQISVSGAEADDLVAESFARVLDTMLDGRGPDSAFRAYLFTTLRHTAYDRTRKDKRLQFTDDITAHEIAIEADDPVLLQMENSFVAKAFGQLPERWRTILWHTQVEGQSPAEVGLILGMSPNAVTSLAFRAREGLREAYLQVHMAETVAERCRTTIDRLGAYTRGGLSKRETAQVQAHLAECDRCPALAAELSEINSGLRGLLAPLLLGSAAAGYIATLPAVPALTQVGATVITSGSTLAKIGTAARVGKTVMSPAVVTGGVMAAAVATVIAVVVGIASNGSTPTADPLTQVAPRTSATSSTPTTSGGGAPGTDAAPTNPSDSGLLAGGTSISITSAPESSSGGGVGTGNGAGIGNGTGNGTGTGIGNGDGTGNGAGTSPTVGTTGVGTQTPVAPTTDPAGAGSTPTGGTGPTVATTSTSTSTTAATTTGGTPTTGTTTTTTPTPITTPTLPPPAAVNVSVTNGISTLTAGRTQTVNVAVTNSGGSTQPAGNAVLSAGPGVTLVGAGIVTNALRNPFTVFAARKAAAPGDVICADNICPLPELAPGASVTVDLQVAVTPAATATDVGLTMYDADVFALQDVPVNSGYRTVTMAPTGTVTAGSNAQFVLTATPADGVSNPGPVTLPAALSDDLYVSSAPLGCQLLDSADFECTPNADGQVGPLTVDTVAVPSASGDQAIMVTDAGGRALQSDTPVTVVPLGSGASVTMTGPFGGTTVGAETLYCSVPTAGDRGHCGPGNSGMLLRDPALAPQLDLQGHSVVWAELTWAVAGRTGDDTVTVTANGTPTSVTGIALPVGASETGQMRAFRQDVTSLITANGSVSVSDLAASTQIVDDTTPFGVWSLAVIWADPQLPEASVTYTNTTTRSLPSVGRPVQVTLARTEGPLTNLFVTLWATDLWGTKNVTFGGQPLPTSIRGVRADGTKIYQTGFDLLSFDATQLGSSSGAINLTNSVDALRREDGVWIGPILAIGPAVPPA